MIPACLFLMILTSKALSRAGVVQILISSTSKSAPSLRILNDFNFQIALARRRGANFAKLNFKSAPNMQCGAVFSRRSFSCTGVVQIFSTSWAIDPSHHLAFRTYLYEPSKPRNYRKTQCFAQFLPAKISHISHLFCTISLLAILDTARPSGNF